jgi:hypothetical protein
MLAFLSASETGKQFDKFKRGRAGHSGMHVECMLLLIWQPLASVKTPTAAVEDRKK